MGPTRPLRGAPARDGSMRRRARDVGSSGRREPCSRPTRLLRRHWKRHQQSQPAPRSSLDAPIGRGRFPRIGAFALDRLGHEHRPRHGYLEREQLHTKLRDRQADERPSAPEAVQHRIRGRPQSVPLLSSDPGLSPPGRPPRMPTAAGTSLPLCPGHRARSPAPSRTPCGPPPRTHHCPRQEAVWYDLAEPGDGQVQFAAIGVMNHCNGQAARRKAPSNGISHKQNLFPKP